MKLNLQVSLWAISAFVFPFHQAQGQRVDNGVLGIPGTCTSSSGSTCAITLNSNNQVISIRPYQFVEHYTNATESARKRMSHLVSSNSGKVILSGFRDNNYYYRMWNLVELDEIKSRVSTMEITNGIENPNLKSNIVPGDVFQSLGNDVSNIKQVIQLSPSKLAHALSEIGRTSTKPSTITKDTGSSFLSTTIVSGIIQGDNTSMAILGARVGNSINVGKAICDLGAAARILGSEGDTVLGVWSLAKSVQRLNNATSQQDTDSGVTHILTGSANTQPSVSSQTTSPANPVIAVGTVADPLTRVDKTPSNTSNENANRIGLLTPLLDLQKSQTRTSGFWSWLGTRKAAYIDSLLGETPVTDLYVQHSTNFLSNNINVLGVVFPSRTLIYTGPCYMTKRYCTWKFLGNCQKWESTETVGRGCDRNKPCSSTWGACSDYNRDHRSGYNVVRCICSGSGKTSFGSVKPNSMVDFRSTRSVYWERSVPSDVQSATFKCKPGNTGFIDYKVSQVTSRADYLCENSMGLLQPSNRRRSGQVMIYDLGDGTDRVFLPTTDRTPNIFRMGNTGSKEYVGGAGSNDFFFDSVCSGVLTGRIQGGLGEDSITLANRCAAGKDVTVDLKVGRISSVGNNLGIHFSSIEAVTGREGHTDTILASCTTRRVAGRGGSSSTKLDQITIPTDSSCTYNATILGASYTKITSSATKGQITIPIGSSWRSMNIDLTTSLSSSLKPVVIFTKTASSQITSLSLTKTGTPRRLTLQTSLDRLDVSFIPTTSVNTFPIYFTETPTGSPNSILFYGGTDEDKWRFYHPLTLLSGSPSRTGSRVMPNVFEITGSNWFAYGGDKDDEFILSTSSVGRIDGGAGRDTVSFNQNFRLSMSIDLGSDKFRNIENVHGVPGVYLSVRTACDTRLVGTQGGTLSTADVITIPGTYCTSRNTLIVATGHSRVIRESRSTNMVANDVIHVVANGNDNRELKFELDTRSSKVENLLVSMVINHKNWTVTEARKSHQRSSVRLEGFSSAGKKDQVHFNLQDDVPVIGSYLQTPLIRISPVNSNEIPGVLLVERATGRTKVLYDVDGLDSSRGNRLQGLLGVENIFRLWASTRDWTLTGGNRNDQFIFSAPENGTGRYFIDGSGGVDNTIFVENGEGEDESTFIVNMAASQLGFLSKTASRRGTIRNIQHVIGRTNASDHIYSTCDTKTISGRGGRCIGTGHDVIVIADRTCTPQVNLLTLVGEFTTVRNTARVGRFSYQVDELLTSSLQVIPSKDSVHLINVRLHPWHWITDVTFNTGTQKMNWRISDGQLERVQEFPLWKSTASTLEYNNPVFSFRPTGSSVNTDIRVNRYGVTMATFLIRGLTNPGQVKGIPVDQNRFLINVPTVSTSPSGEILGFTGGSRNISNQFWITNLASNLKLLDGGACPDRRCTNSIHFPMNSPARNLTLDLDASRGFVKTASGQEVIRLLKNIHEVHGTRNITAHVTCHTSLVTGLGQVIVKSETCPLSLNIRLEEYTKVSFQEGRTNVIAGSAVHYVFPRPMSFDPEGSTTAVIRHNHIYHLSFNYYSFNQIRFDSSKQRLYYTISGVEYSHAMLTRPGHLEQFYPQPVLMTKDGYRIQVSRDGTVWLTNGKTSATVTATTVQTLQQRANNLGVNILFQTSTNFCFLGHHRNVSYRNVLQNVADIRSHLAGGGAIDTIYKVVSLKKDVYIYTGFHDGNTLSSNSFKQTIDLTDIVVPIRQRSGTKYIPAVSSSGGDLIISMTGYEDKYPGKVIIVNGLLPSVRSRVQILLSSSLMDFALAEEAAASQGSAGSTKLLHYKGWTIRPRPVVIPDDIYVFSVSLEDLEDGQDVALELKTQPQSSDRNQNETSKHKEQIFTAIRNGTDLYMTNIGKPQRQSKFKIIVISDFFQKPEEGSEGTALAMLKTMNDTKIRIPVHEITDLEPTDLSRPQTSLAWKRLLQKVEEELLNDMPQISRVFSCKECQPKN